MRVILIQDVKGTGKKGDVVDVSDGFARNMLIKKNLAKPATAVEVNSLKIKKEAEEFHKREEEKRLTALARKSTAKRLFAKPLPVQTVKSLVQSPVRKSLQL